MYNRVWFLTKYILMFLKCKIDFRNLKLLYSYILNDSFYNLFFKKNFEDVFKYVNISIKFVFSFW